jgi:hypothetical protein
MVAKILHNSSTELVKIAFCLQKFLLFSSKMQLPRAGSAQTHSEKKKVFVSIVFLPKYLNIFYLYRRSSLFAV